VEGDRHADEPDGVDDGAPPPARHRPPQDDERPRDKEGDGADAAEHERSEPGKRLYTTLNETARLSSTLIQQRKSWRSCESLKPNDRIFVAGVPNYAQ
jgi:hypothetical protein